MSGYCKMHFFNRAQYECRKMAAVQEPLTVHAKKDVSYYSSLLQYFGFSHYGECRKRGNRFEVLTFGNVPVTYKTSRTLQTRQLTHINLLDITCTAMQKRTVAAYVHTYGVHHLPNSSLETTDFHTSLSSSICQDFMAQESCRGLSFCSPLHHGRCEMSAYHGVQTASGQEKSLKSEGMHKALRGFNRHTLLTH